MARVPFRLPDIGEGIAEAEIVAWHAAIGDMVEEDAALCDLMTDKATVEMSSPVAGRLIERAGEVGDTIAIGSTLAVFQTEAAEKANSVPEPALSPPDPLVSSEAEPAIPDSAGVSTSLDTNGEGGGDRKRILASPAVRARARDLGVDLATIRPAQGDRVRHSDLDAHLRYSGRRHVPTSDAIEEVKVVGLRRRIAENMAEATRAIPHFTYVEEVDVTALEATRAALNEGRGERPRLTLLPFLIRAIVGTVSAFPMINARYDDNANIVSRHAAVHVGIATQTENGLMVPVLRDAGGRDLWQLAAELSRLADAARAGRATRDELSGSTLTLTSLGALGGIVSTPVINRPEVAIVGVNRIVERPAVIDGRIEVRKLMNLSSSFDHRMVDGHDAARFIQAVKRLIETPALLFVAD
jgi:2-oxoisovalerate dehydrogenase E2 component (dihydrolipoyl transacylase)